jgi:hypothetical protein
MMIKRGMISVAAIMIVIFTFQSCKKDKDTTDDSSKLKATWVADDALAQKTYDDVQAIVNEAWATQAKSTPHDSVFLSSCATISLDLSSIPYKLTIDFGTTNCLCSDNKFRRGKIISTFNGAYSDSGTVIRDSLDNYYVNDNKVEGVRVVTNKGHNIAGHLIYEASTNGSIIKANNGGTITWHYLGEREWIAGYDTPWFWLDDEYLISGTSTGTAAMGQTYTFTTLAPLHVKLSCHYITEGIISYLGQGLPEITLDYGDGTCDNTAIATILGQTITIYL